MKYYLLCFLCILFSVMCVEYMFRYLPEPLAKGIAEYNISVQKENGENINITE